MSNKKKSVKTSNFGNIIAILIAIILISCSLIAVFYLLERGQNAIKNYSGNNSAVEQTEISTGHTITEKDMSALENDDQQSEGYLDGAVYIWQNKGYEVFKGTITNAKLYASSINSYKRALGKDYKVYNMVIPTSTEITLPERLSKTFSNNQRENISSVITNLSLDVTPIDVYNILGENRNDYIYYNTDKNWTQKGAYYAYAELTKVLGIDAADISNLNEVTSENSFLGSHITATISKETKNGNPKLLENPDTVTYYNFSDTITVTALEKGNEQPNITNYYNTSVENGSSPMDIYATKECAYTIILNSNITQGKIAVVCDKFGYAIVPFLSENYREVHLIDIDNFERNIKNYLEENQITTVLYLNGIMSANTATKTAKTDAMFN